MYVLPVTTTSGERSFSSLRHLRTLPPNDHECAKISYLMILSVHRNCIESFNVQKIASVFVSRNQKRQIVFGKM